MEELLHKAATIRDEQTPQANTAQRIGEALCDIIQTIMQLPAADQQAAIAELRQKSVATVFGPLFGHRYTEYRLGNVDSDDINDYVTWIRIPIASADTDILNTAKGGLITGNEAATLQRLAKNICSIGEYTSVAEGLQIAGLASYANDTDIRLITFSVPSLHQTVNILQQHFGYICTQIILAEGKTRTTYLRSITLGENYAVGELQQLHLYTTIRVENGMLVGYTADNPDSPNCKRTEICSLATATTHSDSEE